MEIEELNEDESGVETPDKKNLIAPPDFCLEKRCEQCPYWDKCETQGYCEDFDSNKSD